MKIYTKKGDNGSTQLIGGTRIKKNHERIDSYGGILELFLIVVMQFFK